MKGFSFTKSYTRYHIIYGNSAGVVKSTQVLINGFKIGQVEDVDFLAKGNASKIVVTIAVDGDIKMPVGTIAEIASSNLLGNKVIHIRLAENNTYLNANDTLVGKIEQDLSEIVAPIREKSEQVLATLDKVLVSMNNVFDSSGTQKLAKGVDNLTGMLAHLRNITERFDKLTLEQDTRIKDMFAHTESIMRNLRSNNELISHTLKNVKQITDSIAAADLTATINHVNTTLTEFTTLLHKINTGEGTLGELANNQALYQNINNSCKELAALLADMQKYPGRYFTVSVFGNSKRADKADKKRESELKK